MQTMQHAQNLDDRFQEIRQHDRQYGKCLIAAVSMTTGLSYEYCRFVAVRMGWRERALGSWKNYRCVLNYLRAMGITDQAVSIRQSNGSRYTRRSVSKYKGHKVFIAYVKGHAFAVINGKVYDHTPNGLHRIEWIWPVG